MTAFQRKTKSPSLISGFLNGRAETTDFELLLNSVAEYFIEHPEPTWSKDIKQAANTVYHQGIDIDSLQGEVY